MLRNPRGGDEPALAAGAARPRHRGARPDRRVPRRQRRRGARRHARRRPRRVPRAGVGRRRAARGLAVQPRGRRCAPHTPAEAAAVVDAVEDWQDVFARRARPPAGARRRRVLPDGRAGRSRPPTRYEGFPMHEDGIGMARTFELEFTGAVAGRHRRRGAASSPPSTAARRCRRTRPPTPGCGPAHGDAAGRAAAPGATAPIGILTGELGARVLAPLVDALGRDDVRVIPVGNEFFGGNTGVTGLMVGADLDAGARRRAGRPPLPAARRVPVRRRPLPRRRAPSTTCPGRSRSSPPTAARCARALEARDERRSTSCPSSSSSGGPTSARARCSTASSASRRRSSRTARASPATARSSRPSGSACRSG